MFKKIIKYITLILLLIIAGRGESDRTEKETTFFFVPVYVMTSFELFKIYSCLYEEKTVIRF